MDNISLFKKGLKEIDISCSEGQINAFMTCLSELGKWNRAYNLTALKTDEEIIVKHFLDSLLYLRVFPEGALKLADIGSGAGFPGIPVKIIRPETDITLIESSGKKAAFLRHIIRLLKLSAINVLEQRAEALTEEHEKTFDVIVSRATFSIREFLKTACPYVKENGILVLSKGPKACEELKEIERSPYAAGAVRETLKLQLPLTKAERNLIILSCRM